MVKDGKGDVIVGREAPLGGVTVQTQAKLGFKGRQSEPSSGWGAQSLGREGAALEYLSQFVFRFLLVLRVLEARTVTTRLSSD